MTKKELIKMLKKDPAPSDTPVCVRDDECMLGHYIPVSSLEAEDVFAAPGGTYSHRGKKKKRHILVLN